MQSAASKQRIRPISYPEQKPIKDEIQIQIVNEVGKDEISCTATGGESGDIMISNCISSHSEDSQLGVHLSQTMLVSGNIQMRSEFNNTSSEESKNEAAFVANAKTSTELGECKTGPRFLLGQKNINKKEFVSENSENIDLQGEPCELTQHRTLLKSIVKKKVDATILNYGIEFLEIAQSEFALDQREQQARVKGCHSETEQQVGQETISRKLSSYSPEVHHSR